MKNLFSVMHEFGGNGCFISESRFVFLEKAKNQKQSSEKKEKIPEHMKKVSNEIYKNMLVDIAKQGKKKIKELMNPKLKSSQQLKFIKKWIRNSFYQEGYSDKKTSAAGTASADPLDFGPVKKAKTTSDILVRKGKKDIDVAKLARITHAKVFGDKKGTLKKLKQIALRIEIQKAKDGDILATPRQAKDMEKSRVTQKIQSGLQSIAYTYLRWNDLSNPMSTTKQGDRASRIQNVVNGSLYKRGLYAEVSVKGGNLSSQVWYLNADKYWKNRSYLKNTNRVMRDIRKKLGA